MKSALFPGSFDPITVGHADIINRACNIFDKVYVAVADNNEKKCMFPKDLRLQMCREVFLENKKVEAVSFNGMVALLALDLDVSVLIKGLRNTLDFEYEIQIAQVNKFINTKLETLFLTPSPEYQFVSSTVAREFIYYNRSLNGIIPDRAQQLIKSYK